MALVFRNSQEDSITDVVGCNYLHRQIIEAQLPLAESRLKGHDADAVDTIGDALVMLGRFSSCVVNQGTIKEAQKKLVRAIISTHAYSYGDALQDIGDVKNIIGSPL